MAERAAWERNLTPRRVFGVLAVLLAVALLFAPWPDTSTTTPLSSYGTHPYGARGFFEVLERLDFSVERRLRPLRDSLETRAVYVLLEPIVPLTISEVNALLGAVRAGAALLVIPPIGSDLADSLGVRRVPVFPGAQDVPGTGDGIVRFVLRGPAGPRNEDSPFVVPGGGRTFLDIETDEGREPMIAGIPFGRGRVIVAADPSVFRNAVVREGDAAVRSVRLIEWLLTEERDRIVFDEYHHGHGNHVDLIGVTRRTLARTQPGRVVLQTAAAGLLLLLAVGARPIRPRPSTRIERRSPLEHVGALARAYHAVHAVPRASRLLIRGLRRRHGGVRPGRDDEAFLRAIAQRAPNVEEDVALLRSVLDGRRADGADVTRAIHRIEQELAA